MIEGTLVHGVDADGLDIVETATVTPSQEA